MPSLLAEARSKTLTENLFNQVLDELSSGNGRAGDAAFLWWQSHKTELVGLATAEVISLFATAQKKKNLVERYDALLASMSWKEKIEFLRMGVKQMKTARSKRIRQAALLDALIDAAPKIITVIVMVI